MLERDALYFEDFEVGRRFVSRGVTMSEAAIMDFAFKYDPQPFHIDKPAAAESMYGGIIASGFHTLAVAFRMMYQENVFSSCNIGSPGLDELRWRKPVYAGDTIHTEIEVLDAEPSRSRPDRGRVRMGWTVKNQDDETVMTVTLVHIMLRRPGGSSAGESGRRL